MRKRPKLTLLLASITGLLVGLSGDFVAGGVDLSLGNVILAVVMAPILAAVGGRAVAIPASDVFLIGGLLFWPTYAALAWRWLRRGQEPLVALGIAVWSAQGFFQVVHRLAMLMSA